MMLIPSSKAPQRDPEGKTWSPFSLKLWKSRPEEAACGSEAVHTVRKLKGVRYGSRPDLEILYRSKGSYFKDFPLNR